MNNENFIKGKDEDEVWQQITEQFLQDPDRLQYVAIIDQGNHRIVLNIDIDPGGGFESGYETTTLTAPIHPSSDFRFAINEEHFTDEIGKFFGMQDVVIGYHEFDEKLIIKTNDKDKVRKLFSDASVRELFQSLHRFTFGISSHRSSDNENKQPFLELFIETGITDLTALRAIYKAFFSVLTSLEK